jgi:hypothetical protein
VFSLRRPSADAMARLVAEQSELELTYAEHGATEGELPPGYSHDQWEADLGQLSQEQFDRLAESLRRWRVQLGSGMTIVPVEPVTHLRAGVRAARRLCHRRGPGGLRHDRA